MTYDLRKWLVDDLDDSLARLYGQVFGCVPADQRTVRADGGGNSIDWVAFHVARHASLALAVVGGAGLGGGIAGRDGGAGLEESEPTWAHELDGAAIEADTAAAFGRVRSYLERLDLARLDDVPDAGGVLGDAQVPREEYGWLYATWVGRPVAWFVRWPLVGHLSNHVGEMISTRNRLGLSPF